MVSRWPRVWALLLLVSVLTGGCTRMILDVRDLQVPVMVNRLPPPNADWTAGVIRPFEVSLQEALGAIVPAGKNASHAAVGDWKTDTQARADAQTTVRAAVAGVPNAALSEANMEVTGAGMNLGFFFVGAVTIKATANVVSIERRPTNTPPLDANAGRVSDPPPAFPSETDASHP
jgi:hypothetical protein